MRKFNDGDRFRHKERGHRGFIVRMETAPNGDQQYVVKWDSFPIICYYFKTEVEPEWEVIPTPAGDEFKKMMDEHTEQIIKGAAVSPCELGNHDWKTYTGLHESFEHCSVCGKKKSDVIYASGGKITMNGKVIGTFKSAELKGKLP